VDLTEEYCQTARWLNQLAGLDDRITVRQADVTDLPFEDATFTLMFSQHVQMNVADKPLLYVEARRVLTAKTANPTFRCPGPTGPKTVT
jgi:ubiquinone/menaquinone biosynthesis C-methylase UbiE